MGTIHIGIGHNNNLVITELRNIEVVSVSFGKSTAERIDHGFDFRIGQYLINTCLLHIQDLATNRKNRLIGTVSGCFGTAACGISLDNEDFALGSVPGFTVCQLSVRIKGKLLLREHIGLCFFFGFTDFGGFFGTADNIL